MLIRAGCDDDHQDRYRCPAKEYETQPVVLPPAPLHGNSSFRLSAVCLAELDLASQEYVKVPFLPKISPAFSEFSLGKLITVYHENYELQAFRFIDNKLLISYC